MLRSFAWPCLLLAGAALGCTSSEPSSESAESLDQDVTVKPTGTGDLATVTVHLPAGYRATIPELGAHFEYRFNGTVLTPDTATKVLPAASEGHWGCLEIALKTASTTIGRSFECVYQLAAGETKTINLALLKVWWSNYPNAWASMVTSEAKGRAMLTRDTGPNAYPQWDIGGPYALNGRNDIALPVVGGTYRYRIEGSTLPAFVYDVPAGAQADRNAAYDDYLGYLDIGFPDREGFAEATPNASRAVISCPGVSQTFAAAPVAAPVSVSILGGGSGTSACTYNVNGFTGPVAVKAKTHVALPLVRLNIEDVALTDEPGVKVAGTYAIRRFEAASGNWGAWAASGKTNTGLDVPNGKYQIRISYSPHGQAKEQWQEVEL